LRRAERLDNGGTPPAGRTKGLDSQRPTRRFPLRSCRQPCGSTAAGPYRTGRQNLGAVGGGRAAKAGAARRARCTGPFPLSVLPSAPWFNRCGAPYFTAGRISALPAGGRAAKAGAARRAPFCAAHFHFRSYHHPCGSALAERPSTPAGRIKSWRRRGRRAARPRPLRAPPHGARRAPRTGAHTHILCTRPDGRCPTSSSPKANHGRHARAKSATCSIS
jgi:hypothetical protein